MDLSRLRRGERIAAISAVLLLIDMFLNWYALDFTNVLPGRTGEAARALGVAVQTSESINAWQSFDILDLFLLLVIAVAVVLALLTATQRSVALPVAASVITTILGGLATLIVLVRLLDQPGPNRVIDVEFWAYIGLILCAGIAVGGWLAMRDEGATIQDARIAAERAVRGEDIPTRPAPPPEPLGPPGEQGSAPPPPRDEPPPRDAPPPATPPPGTA
jgi:hypothetical protein